MSWRRFTSYEARIAEARQVSLQKTGLHEQAPGLASMLEANPNAKVRITGNYIEMYTAVEGREKTVAEMYINRYPQVDIERIMKIERRHRRNSAMGRSAAVLAIATGVVLGPVRGGLSVIGNTYAEIVDGDPCRNDAERQAMPAAAALRLQSDAEEAHLSGLRLDETGVLTITEQRAVTEDLHQVSTLTITNLNRCELADGTDGDSDLNGRSVSRKAEAAYEDLTEWIAVADQRLADRNEAARRLAEGGYDPSVLFPETGSSENS